MKIILSRKGFDSAAGGAPSPIIRGCPTSLPIPTQARSETTYGHLELGDIVEHTSKRKYTASSLCHNDPMFEKGRCAFGQCGAAQSHLANNGVGEGDVFLFFGLFSNEDLSDRHHRIYGFLKVEEVLHLGPSPSRDCQPKGFSLPHPHTIGEWNDNNTLYLGSGSTAVSSPNELRLTKPNSNVSHWKVPPFLKKAGLTYHGNSNRWHKDGTLTAAARGQEFISDVSEYSEGVSWQESVIDLINAKLGCHQ